MWSRPTSPKALFFLPSFIAARLNKVIPIGFPITRPATIPNPMGAVKAWEARARSNTTAVLARAKVGMIKRVDTGAQ